MIGLAGWIGGTVFAATMSSHFDSAIESDTIIFHGWGLATIVILVIGVSFPLVGLLVGLIVGRRR